MKKVIVIGAGGHSRSVIHAFLCNNNEPFGILDKKKDRDEKVLNIPIIDEISSFQLFRYFNIFHCDW